MFSYCGLVAKSHPSLATPWTVAYQAPPTMGFSRQEYWSGSPFPSPRFRKGLLIVLKHLKGFQMTALWNYTE